MTDTQAPPGVRCTNCAAEMTPENSVPAKRMKNGLSSWCRSCHAERSRRWQKENPEKVRAARKERYHRMRAEGTWKRQPTDPVVALRRHLRHYYGVTLEWFNEQLERQGGCCAICGIPAVDLQRRLVVDHDHDCCPGSRSCGRCVRELLCSNCNRTLGLFEADGWFAKANAYIERNRRGL